MRVEQGASLVDDFCQPLTQASRNFWNPRRNARRELQSSKVRSKRPKLEPRGSAMEDQQNLAQGSYEGMLGKSLFLVATC